MRPDVTFDDRNERFDLTSLIDEQNRQFDNNHKIDDSEYRRNAMTKSRRNAIDNIRRYDYSDNNFAFHDDMNSSEDGVGDFETNLVAYRIRNGDNRRFEGLVDYLHGGDMVIPKRRSDGPDPEKEILLHYAVPIDMKIKGYLQVPVVE
ncbi:uncharacterized protein LOC131849887 [Achroia grisella]|uniref:uncharacterized protein LOC131849887 n=1 Tax=Achroia grisella TaxID=688607 RepID=UPI0027D263B0|nr:uncharacterized protein LOC131849887 [Achroia grisella]